MKRIIATMTGVVFLATSVFASQWAAIAEKLDESVVYIESKQGSCTGFVIDNERDYVLTAAHCDGLELYVDQTPAKVVSKDAKKDLLVLYVKDIDRPALKLANKDPKRGEELASFGFGYGLERPLMRVSHVSDDKTYIAEEGIGGPLLVVDTSFVPGQSGGPVVNALGEVSMIVQMGNDVVGLGVGAELIKSKVGKYFEKSK